MDNSGVIAEAEYIRGLKGNGKITVEIPKKK